MGGSNLSYTQIFHDLSELLVKNLHIIDWNVKQGQAGVPNNRPCKMIYANYPQMQRIRTNLVHLIYANSL